MKSSILKNLGPGTQLMMLVFILFVTVFMMQMTAFLIIRPIWGINIFDNIEIFTNLENQEEINIYKVVIIFNQLGMFLIPALVFRSLFRESNKNFFVFEIRQNYVTWIIVFLFFIIAIPIINYIEYLNLQIPFPNNIQEEDKEASEILNKLLGGNGMSIYINLFMLGVLPAIGEEFIFRGIILRQLALATKKIHLAVWISATFFTLVHAELTLFIPRLLMGVFLGYLYVWKGNIWLNVLAHFINNVFIVVFSNLLLNDQINPNYISFGINSNEIIYVAISLIIISVFVYYLYKTRNNKFKNFIDEQPARIKYWEKDDDVLDDEE